MDELRERINKILEKYNHAVHDHCIDEILAALPAPLDVGEVEDVVIRHKLHGARRVARAICARFSAPTCKESLQVEWPRLRSTSLMSPEDVAYNKGVEDAIAAYERERKGGGRGQTIRNGKRG